VREYATLGFAIQPLRVKKCQGYLRAERVRLFARGLPMKGSHANRKATKEEMAYATQVIQGAYPEYEIVWGSHGDYGGHRAPRDHTLAFRLRDKRGKYRSNVIWVAPESLSSITVGWVKKMVARGTSDKARSRRR
jgi:hypothetical protein